MHGGGPGFESPRLHPPNPSRDPDAPVAGDPRGIGGPDGPNRFLGSVPYPLKSNTAFTPFTTPSSKPAKPGGVPVHITNIRRLPDGRITFHIGYEYL